VLIESQPSGALVNVGGQVLGVTPLSTLLPVGTQQLSISKPGYVSEQAFVQLDPAPRGAKAMRTRVVLHESEVESASSLPPARVSAPARSTRSAPRRAVPRRPVEPSRDEPPAPAAALEVTPEPVHVEASAPAPLVETTERPRLLDEQSRARLLE
jgi:hypothetical protein